MDGKGEDCRVRDKAGAELLGPCGPPLRSSRSFSFAREEQKGGGGDGVGTACVGVRLLLPVFSFFFKLLFLPSFFLSNPPPSPSILLISSWGFFSNLTFHWNFLRSPLPILQFLPVAIRPCLARSPRGRLTKAPLKSRVILHFSASHASQRIRAL